MMIDGWPVKIILKGDSEQAGALLPYAGNLLRQMNNAKIPNKAVKVGEATLRLRILKDCKLMLAEIEAGQPHGILGTFRSDAFPDGKLVVGDKLPKPAYFPKEVVRERLLLKPKTKKTEPTLKYQIGVNKDEKFGWFDWVYHNQGRFVGYITWGAGVDLNYQMGVGGNYPFGYPGIAGSGLHFDGAGSSDYMAWPRRLNERSVGTQARILSNDVQTHAWRRFTHERSVFLNNKVICEAGYDTAVISAAMLHSGTGKKALIVAVLQPSYVAGTAFRCNTAFYSIPNGKIPAKQDWYSSAVRILNIPHNTKPSGVSGIPENYTIRPFQTIAPRFNADATKCSWVQPISYGTGTRVDQYLNTCAVFHVEFAINGESGEVTAELNVEPPVLVMANKPSASYYTWDFSPGVEAATLAIDYQGMKEVRLMGGEDYKTQWPSGKPVTDTWELTEIRASKRSYWIETDGQAGDVIETEQNSLWKWADKDGQEDIDRGIDYDLTFSKQVYWVALDLRYGLYATLRLTHRTAARTYAIFVNGDELFTKTFHDRQGETYNERGLYDTFFDPTEYSRHFYNGIVDLSLQHDHYGSTPWWDRGVAGQVQAQAGYSAFLPARQAIIQDWAYMSAERLAVEGLPPGGLQGDIVKFGLLPTEYVYKQIASGSRFAVGHFCTDVSHLETGADGGLDYTDIGNKVCTLYCSENLDWGPNNYGTVYVPQYIGKTNSICEGYGSENLATVIRKKSEDMESNKTAGLFSLGLT